jgi:AbrB family looped-hinge helix DNA binding protein
VVKSDERAITRVDDQGRVLVPASIRRRLRLTPGSELMVWVEDGELRAQTLEEGIKRAQAIVTRHTKGKKGLLEEFLAERRREAELD